jgi:hypothetical protein
MNSLNKSLIARYFHQKVTVVEVDKGESKEEAWRRHLLKHPDSVGADIKIFHYAHKRSPQPGVKDLWVPQCK